MSSLRDKPGGHTRRASKRHLGLVVDDRSIVAPVIEKFGQTHLLFLPRRLLSVQEPVEIAHKQKLSSHRSYMLRVEQSDLTKTEAAVAI